MPSDDVPPADGERRGEDAPARPDELAWSEEEEPAEHPWPGSIQFQDAATTTPRPPTPAELRAREKYEKKQQQLEEARIAAEAKRRHQRRVLMGTAAGVGVVGVIAALGYWATSAPNVTAQCVREDPNGQPIIVPDSYCAGHTPGLGGLIFLGGHQYRYYYGSTGSVGTPPMGGTTVPPRGANITTKSGTTIQRGGLGGKLGGGGAGGGDGAGRSGGS